MLPDDYIRRMKQDLAESDALVESKARYVPVVPTRPRRATSESYYVPFPDDDPPNFDF
jgi:hypothetical protein